MTVPSPEFKPRRLMTLFPNHPCIYLQPREIWENPWEFYKFVDEMKQKIGRFETFFK